MQATPYEDVMQAISKHRDAGIPISDLLATLIRIQEELEKAPVVETFSDEDAFENMPV